jgi:hypothetical protein
MDGSTSIQANYEGLPSKFVKNILKKSECSVIIAPEHFEPIEEVIFAFDGSASAAYAIKQFALLFPQLFTKTINVLHIDTGGIWHSPEIDVFKEWLSFHYRQINFVGIKDNIDRGLLNFLFEKRKSMVIMGAYGRDSLSMFFKPSHSDKLVRILSQPIFITHL